MKITNVKGCYDFLPSEAKVKNYINGVLKEVFESYGYLPIETPILMNYDILSDKYDEGNDILKEIYKLSDQGERKLGLRYDLTVPFAKLIALNKNDIKLPFKRYEINKVFRDGPVKLGRDREFTQCDIDVVGLAGQEIEAELISLYVEAFKRFDIDFIIKFNSRNLMRGIVASYVSEDLIGSVITVIDKINKISKEEFIDELVKLGVSLDNSNKLLEYFKMDLDSITKEFKNSDNLLISKGINELNNLNDMLNDLDLSCYTVYDASLARGQEYYTGNVFEVYDRSGMLTSSIGGGGRYDNMITNFIDDGNLYPAVGVSFGLSSLYELLKDRDMFKSNNNIDILAVPLDADSFNYAFKVSNKLRSMGYNVLTDMNNRKLKNSLNYANKEFIKYVVIVGSSEVESNTINLKDMDKSENYLIKLDDIDKINEIICKK